MTRAQTSTPTMSLEVLMISSAIDAKEGLYAVVAVIHGAFLHVDMDTDVHMLLEGTIAELIVNLKTRLSRKYIWRNKSGKPMLYVKLRKTLLGTLQAALIFCRLLSDTLI